MHRTTLSQLRLASFPKHTILGPFRCLNFRLCYQNVWAKHGFLGWATKNVPNRSQEKGEENVRSLTSESLNPIKVYQKLSPLVISQNATKFAKGSRRYFWGRVFGSYMKIWWFTMLILLIWSHNTCWSRWWTCGSEPRHGANLLPWRHYHGWLPPLTALCLGPFL